MKKTFYNFEWQGLEKCQFAKEKSVHIHMDAGYMMDSGWTPEQRKTFEEELYPKLEEAGYFIEKHGNGHCDMLYRADRNGNRDRYDEFNLYMHPSDFAGYASDEDIDRITEILNSCKCISNARPAFVKEVYDMDDSQYVAFLARNYDGIRRYVKGYPEKDRWMAASEFAEHYRIPRVNERNIISSSDIDICFIRGIAEGLLKEKEDLEMEEPERQKKERSSFMTYEEYKGALKEYLTDVHGLDIKEDAVGKDSVIMDRWVVTNQEFEQTLAFGSAYPAFYPKHFYDCSMTFEEVSEAIDSHKNEHTLPSIELNKDFILDNVTMRSVPDRNLNEDSITRKYLDFCLQYVIPIRTNIGTTGHLVLTNQLASKYGISEKELFKRAVEHLEEQDVVIEKMDSVVESLGGSLPEEAKGSPMYVMTNRDGYYGAVMIISEKALKQAQKELGENYFILPSSKHEVLLIPASKADIESLGNMVRKINKTELPETDYLADSVYYYDGMTDKLFIVEERDRVQEEDEHDYD